MKLTEAYNKVILEDFWNGLEEGLIVEADSGLKSLIGQANDVIFKKFGLKPTDDGYSIVGSARLYLYPQLREAFGLDGSIGDLDMVIPNKQDWVNAGLEENWNKGGIYRPTDDGSIEAFNVWDPSRAGGKYADVQVRSTQVALADIIDYKMSMNREKEQDIVNLITAYQKSGSSNKMELLKRMAKVIGIDATKEFLGKVSD
jgi:hypothetical protein